MMISFVEGYGGEGQPEMEEEPDLVGIDVGSLLTGLEWRGPSSGGGGRKQIGFSSFSGG